MLEGYRVDPAGVQGVLDDAAAAGTAIAKALAPLEAALRESGPAGDGVSGAGLITAALHALDEHVAAGIDVVTARLPAASQGLHGATVAVAEGDEAMAARIRTAAAGAPGTRTGDGRWAR